MKIKIYLHRSYLRAVSLQGAIAFGVLQLLVYSAPANAQTLTINNVSEVNSKILCPIFNWMFTILLAVSVIMILVGGFTYVTAGGDSEKVGKATKTITYAAIGIAVAIMAKSFPIVIGSLFGVNGGLTPC